MDQPNNVKANLRELFLIVSEEEYLVWDMDLDCRPATQEERRDSAILCLKEIAYLLGMSEIYLNQED